MRYAVCETVFTPRDGEEMEPFALAIFRYEMGAQIFLTRLLEMQSARGQCLSVVDLEEKRIITAWVA